MIVAEDQMTAMQLFGLFLCFDCHTGATMCRQTWEHEVSQVC